MGTNSADIIIVGAGVIGLSIARELAQANVGRIVVVERGAPGAEASYAAGGMLAPQSEADTADAFFRFLCLSRDMYPSFSAALFEESGIDIELDRTGTLYLAFSDVDLLEIEHRYHWQHAAGLPVERLTTVEALNIEPRVSPSVPGALRFPLDIQVDNRKLVTALVRSVERAGIEIVSNTAVDSLIVRGGTVLGVRTSAGDIEGGLTILANGAWMGLLTAGQSGIPNTGMEPVRGQMLCYMPESKPVRHVIYSPRGYLVPRMDGRLLAGSTSEQCGFEKTVTATGIQTIISNAAEILSGIPELPIVDSWSGLRPHSCDDLPVIGRVPEVERLYLAGGHYRNGILLTPATGRLVASEITTGSPATEFADFRPERFHVLANI